MLMRYYYMGKHMQLIGINNAKNTKERNEALI